MYWKLMSSNELDFFEHVAVHFHVEIATKVLDGLYDLSLSAAATAFDSARPAGKAVFWRRMPRKMGPTSPWEPWMVRSPGTSWSRLRPLQLAWSWPRLHSSWEPRSQWVQWPPKRVPGSGTGSSKAVWPTNADQVRVRGDCWPSHWNSNLGLRIKFRYLGL